MQQLLLCAANIPAYGIIGVSLYLSFYKLYTMGIGRVAIIIVYAKESFSSLPVCVVIFLHHTGM